MLQALVAAASLFTAAAQDQSTPPASTGAATPVPLTAQEQDRIKREVDARVEQAKKEIRDEVRAQLATQSATEGWQQDWTEEKRKLDLLQLDGYFRVRPDLFNKFDLGRLADPMGYYIFPKQGTERTVDGVNTRFRLDPTLNISEEVRIKAQVDALDNLVWGSTPDYAYSMSDRINLGLLSKGQTAPAAGVNSIYDSIRFKRVWGEVATPVGIFRFGRMGVHWGLGIYHNDGNCLDCDYGETQDQAQFVVEPLPGYFIIPEFQMNAAGLTGSTYWNQGPNYNLAQADDTYSYVLVLARRDTEAQAKARLENNLSVFNYGVHFTYRHQGYESGQQGQTFSGSPQTQNPYIYDLAAADRVYRGGSVYIPDAWVKYETKRFRLEAEGVGIFGTTSVNGYISPQNQTNQNGFAPTVPLTITQWAGALESEVRFFDGALRVGLDLGAASGDRAPGFGNHPGRRPLPGSQQATAGASPYVGTVPGDIDGPQYCVAGPGLCPYSDSSIRNFQFSRDYHVDMILWRELLGGVTDAFYLRPNISYTITEGLKVYLAAIYSQALYASSTPSTVSSALGIELNGGVSYQSEDGFFADLRYGVLFPLSGLQSTAQFGTAAPSLDIAQAVRGNIGIKF